MTILPKMPKLKKPVKFKTSVKHQEHKAEYQKCIADLIDHESVQQMEGFRHHYRTNCLAHSLNVSYFSYRICRFCNMDYRSAARGALLHDLFLYDWRETDLEEGRHAFVHPRIALQNATDVSELNDIEQDIVLKHMWPLTPHMPSFKESLVVCMMDKYCTTLELGFGQRRPLPSANLISMMDQMDERSA